MKAYQRMMNMVFGAALAAGMIFACGCDDTSVSEVIDVEPGTVEMEGRGSALLTARLRGEDATTSTNQVDNLFLPLEWSVQNPDLGGVMSRGGHSAVYESSGRRGANVVFVKDQIGREGVVAVNQR